MKPTTAPPPEAAYCKIYGALRVTEEYAEKFPNDVFRNVRGYRLRFSGKAAIRYHSLRGSTLASIIRTDRNMQRWECQRVIVLDVADAVPAEPEIPPFQRL
jgi:hypothetical protein